MNFLLFVCCVLKWCVEFVMQIVVVQKRGRQPLRHQLIHQLIQWCTTKRFIVQRVMLLWGVGNCIEFIGGTLTCQGMCIEVVL
jgi:hypothetical protein